MDRDKLQSITRSESIEHLFDTILLGMARSIVLLESCNELRDLRLT